MEEAIQTIRLLKESLPHKPHVLCISPTKRCTRPSDPKRFEEEARQPLQYMTFIAPEDRGEETFLFTRGYDDMREDNSEAAPNSNAPPRSDSKKPVTKMSFKDYKARKKSLTPPESGEILPKISAKLNHPLPPKPPIDLSKGDHPSFRPSDNNRPTKAARPATKTESHRQRSPSPERKKRPSDMEEQARPLKRSKPDSASSRADVPRPPRSEIPQKAERNISHSRNPSKDLKTSTITNGHRSLLGAANARDLSPRPSPKVNGVTKSAAGSTYNTPKKAEKDGAPRSSVPPLLSPLRLSFDESEVRKPKSPIKGASEMERSASSQNKKRDIEPDSAPKKRKAPLELPPLLSPTLPAIVMEELARLKNTPSKDSSQLSSQSSDSPGSAKKAPANNVEKEVHVSIDREKPKERFIVVLKYKRRNVKSVQRILALQSMGKKESIRREERLSRERSNSVEQPIARKRPRAGTDAGSEALKRPRTSDLPPPSTPSKHATAMSRVASSNSQAATPGDLNITTPRASAPSTDRPQTGVPVDPEKVGRFKRRSQFFVGLGTKMKHERDAILKTKSREGSHSQSISESDRKKAILVGIESTLAYMIGFKAINDQREHEQKPRDFQPWSSLIPHLRIATHESARWPTMNALAWRLTAICHAEISRAMCFLDPAAIAKNMVKNAKEQDAAWRQAYQSRRRLSTDDEAGRLLDQLGPWTNPDGVIPLSLSFMRQATGAERMDWKPSNDLASAVTNGSA